MKKHIFQRRTDWPDDKGFGPCAVEECGQGIVHSNHQNVTESAKLRSDQVGYGVPIPPLSDELGRIIMEDFLGWWGNHVENWTFQNIDDYIQGVGVDKFGSFAAPGAGQSDKLGRIRQYLIEKLGLMTVEAVEAAEETMGVLHGNAFKLHIEAAEAWERARIVKQGIDRLIDAGDNTESGLLAELFNKAHRLDLAAWEATCETTPDGGGNRIPYNLSMEAMTFGNSNNALDAAERHRMCARTHEHAAMEGVDPALVEKLASQAKTESGAAIDAAEFGKREEALHHLARAQRVLREAIEQVGDAEEEIMAHWPIKIAPKQTIDPEPDAGTLRSTVVHGLVALTKLLGFDDVINSNATRDGQIRHLEVRFVDDLVEDVLLILEEENDEGGDEELQREGEQREEERKRLAAEVTTDEGAK